MENNQLEESAQAQLAQRPNQYKIIMVIIGLVIVSLLGFAAYRIHTRQLVVMPPVLGHNNSDSQNGSMTVTTTPDAVQPESSPTSTAPSSTISAKVIEDEYSLFMNTQSERQYGNSAPSIQYIDDGVINSGKYAGYHRIIAGVSFDQPGGPVSYIFATKDYKTFVLSNANAGDVEDYNGIDSNFNKAKVLGLGSIPLDEPPAVIDLGNFVLSLGQINFDAKAGSELTSVAPGFTFYAALDPYNNLSTSTSAYIDSLSSVYAKDSYGVMYDYTLDSKESYKRRTPTNNYDFNFYKRTEIQSTAPLYDAYGQLFPGGCGQADRTYVLKNISTNDVTQVGVTTGGVILYTLGDPSHPLNVQEYQQKVTNSADYFSSINNIPAPSYKKYVSKNPVLLFKDPWNRWVGLGEWQYQTSGGCGKPVIYLYPQTPTKVTVQFTNPMHFNTTIPTYSGQWNVLANPNGALQDLQPKLTNCDAINYSLDGSAYAQSACKSGIYPYLYWAGQTTNSYPIAKSGWVVSKEDLPSFLDAKLKEVGLNDTEKSDMLSYWVPVLIAKNSPYYRISFFQTQTMKNFVPMNINPKPDTVFRIFLDWSLLSEQPNDVLPPENLQHLDRKGFTVVEWGGILK